MNRLASKSRAMVGVCPSAISSLALTHETLSTLLPADSTVAKPIEKNTYIGVPLAGAGRDHGMADNRNQCCRTAHRTLRALHRLRCLRNPNRDGLLVTHASCYCHRPAATIHHEARDVEQGD